MGHLDDGSGTCMGPGLEMEINHIRNIIGDIGDGASDRTTTGRMQSNIHAVGLCDIDLV